MVTRQPEGKLVSKARQTVVLRGGRPFKIQGGADAFQETGIPDLLVCYRGRFVGAEAKMPGNHPSAKQAAILDEIADAGGYALVFSTVREVSRLLLHIDQEVEHAASSRADWPRRFNGTRPVSRFR